MKQAERVKEETPKERGRRWGAFFKAEGRFYGKLSNGHYPSNPYPYNSADADCYDEGYEEAVNGK